MRDILLDGTFVAIDIETTGFDVKTAEIIDLGAVKVEGGIITETYSTLVDPGFFIPDHIKDLTGITNAMTIGSPKIEQALPEFMDFLGDYILIGHNIEQDLKFLGKYTRLMGKQRLKRPVLCTLQLSRRLLPGLHSYSLKDVADHLSINYNRLHRALDDARITALVFLELLELLWNNYGIDDYISIKKISKTGRV